MHEILFQYGPFALTTFSALLAVGLVASTLFLVRYVQFKKMALRFVVNHFFLWIASALVVGRIFYVAEHWFNYSNSLISVIQVWDMGLSPFGMLVASLGLLVYLSRKDHEDFWAWLDALTLASLVALFFVHWGHFFNGSDYGKPTDLPWGIAFDNFNIPYQTPIHPTQIYSALATFLVLNVAMITAKRTHLTGVAGNLAIMLYSLSALGIDFLHGEPSLYAKVAYGILASMGFVLYVHCTHRKLIRLKS